MSAATAFLFPGQGSQTVGMGRDLADQFPTARQTFDEADEALGIRLSTLCWEGSEDRLRMTEITQPAILTVSVAAWRVLAEHGVQLRFAAGHSLGEYSAHVAAGTLSFADAVRTVRNRGRYMQEAVPPGVGAMAALLGLSAEDVRAACAEAMRQLAGRTVAAANLNAPEQIVVSGHKDAVEKAADLAKEMGAKRAVMLPVSAPFHCSLMQPAQDRLAVDLAALAFRDPAVPVVTNVDVAFVRTGDAARDALVRQVTGAVRWVESVQALVAEGVERFIEVGPGKVLTGLMRQIDRSRATANVEDAVSLRKTLDVAAS